MVEKDVKKVPNTQVQSPVPKDGCWKLGTCNSSSVEALFPCLEVSVEHPNVKRPPVVPTPYAFPEQPGSSWSEGLCVSGSIWQYNVTSGRVAVSSEWYMKWKMPAWCRKSMHSAGWYTANRSNKRLLHRFSTLISNADDNHWVKYFFFPSVQMKKNSSAL